MIRVLLAEDDRPLRSAIVRGLQEAGYAVEAVGTGTQALELVTAQDFEAIILDILLPGMSGIEVCRDIRARDERQPILMLTALDSVEQRITGLDAGADDYLTKPFDFGELLARLRALTRRHGEGSAALLTVGDLVIDVRRHEVRRGTRDISLTAREFALLTYLARHAGTVVTRAELMTHVWDDSGPSYSNIIDVYASRLRRKIDDGESAALFTTVRGTGFVLEAPGTSRRGTARKAT